MKFRLWSDVHNEFGKVEFRRLESDKDTTLIIAGDWATPADPCFDILGLLCGQFKCVVFVPGNHDYWNSSIKLVDQSFRRFAEEHDNFRYLNPGVTIIDDTLVIGATLWTDCDKSSPLGLYRTKKYMEADFSKIEEFKTLPQNWLYLHYLHRNFIQDSLNVNCFKKLVVTHHAPHARCDPEHGFNSGFCCSDMDELINLSLARTWLFGHTHVPVDFELNGVRMISNPRGYEGFEDLASVWDDTKIYEV